MLTIKDGAVGETELKMPARQSWVWASVVFIIGFVVRFGGVIHTGQYLNQPRWEVARAALAVAESGSLADPFTTPTGPTAHVSPGYTLLLGLVFRVFGSGAGGDLAKAFLACLITALQFGSFVFAAQSLGMPRRVGIVAGVLGACIPLAWPMETFGDWEANAVAVLLIFLVALTVTTWRKGAIAGWSGGVHGLLWGCAGLFSPVVLAAEAGLVAVGVLVFRDRLGHYLRFSGLLALGTVVAMAPWGARNWVQLGYPILTRSDLGLELYISNNDMARPSLTDNMPVLWASHPSFQPEEAAEVRRLGEVGFNRQRRRLAMDWIRGHPARFARLSVDRIGEFWFPSTLSPLRQLLFGMLTLFGFAGAGLLFRSDKLAATALWTVLLTFPLIYYVVQTAPRYRYPIDWISLLGSVYALSRVARMLSEGNGKTTPMNPSATSTLWRS